MTQRVFLTQISPMPLTKMGNTEEGGWKQRRRSRIGQGRGAGG
jgi:hypothetical protein